MCCILVAGKILRQQWKSLLSSLNDVTPVLPLDWTHLHHLSYESNLLFPADDPDWLVPLLSCLCSLIQWWLGLQLLTSPHTVYSAFTRLFVEMWTLPPPIFSDETWMVHGERASFSHLLRSSLLPAPGAASWSSLLPVSCAAKPRSSTLAIAAACSRCD